jgi:hypothetical protein
MDLHPRTGEIENILAAPPLSLVATALPMVRTPR